jgi:hypothetical protein
MKNSKQSDNAPNSATGRPRDTGNGAHEPSKSIRAEWSARILRQGSLVGEAFIEFSFPTRGGGQSRILAPYNNIEDRHKNRLIDELTNLLPIFPPAAGSNEDAQIKFIRELVDTASIELLPEKTGFVDANTFVTHSEILHSDGSRTPVPTRSGPAGKSFADIKGTPKGTTELVLKLAIESTYLAFGIGVSLAAPLPSYMSVRRSADDDLGPLVRETADFNFSGRSSSGKSSVCLATLSLLSSPDRAGTLDFSKRGLAEMASDSNDLHGIG